MYHHHLYVQVIVPPLLFVKIIVLPLTVCTHQCTFTGCIYSDLCTITSVWSDHHTTTVCMFRSLYCHYLDVQIIVPLQCVFINYIQIIVPLPSVCSGDWTTTVCMLRPLYCHYLYVQIIVLPLSVCSDHCTTVIIIPQLCIHVCSNCCTLIRSLYHYFFYVQITVPRLYITYIYLDHCTITFCMFRSLYLDCIHI